MTTNRKRLSDRMRAELFRDHGGICHLCSRRIGPGELWDVEHVTALGLSGADDASNWSIAHVDCHRGKGGKTSEDRQKMAKADRAAKRHAGITRSSRPLPGSRNSPWKALVGGGWVKR